MQIIHGGFYHLQSMNNRIRVVPIDGPRGKIMDSNGVVLADNRMVFHVGIVPQDVEDKNALFNYLGEVLDRSPVFLERQFDRNIKTHIKTLKRRRKICLSGSYRSTGF